LLPLWRSSPHPVKTFLMDIKQAGAGLGLFAGIAAGAALVRWPYNLVAEAIMATAALLAAATIVAWSIGLFYERIKVVFKRVTLLAAGSLLGVYVAIAAAYFGGYIGYNYPASQERLSSQSKEITELTASLTATKADLASTQNQLIDAKKAMADPHSISAPAYNLDTSLKLQFDNTGSAQTIESHNIRWVATSVRQATEISPAPAPPQPPASNCPNAFDITCNRNSLGLVYQQPECPRPGPTYQTNDALLLMLTFPYPIRVSDIKLEAHGVALPEKNILKLTEQNAVIMFQASLRNTVLDITATQPNK
jgi:hypothetical protein